MQALQAAAAEAVDLRHQLAEATSAAAALAAVRQQQEAALAKAAGDVAAAGEAANQLRSLVDALTAGDQVGLLVACFRCCHAEYEPP